MSNIGKSIDIEDGTFAEACYDSNTIEELIEGLEQMHADKTDMATWNITPTEWRRNIALALRAKIEDLEYATIA